ncbi:MAG: isocitrate lyase/phosphoenolpyruvate mutase family protein [Porphyrobacter sp.]|nr:isocitrate lyase/phosphoenolpyruvate mutase family protein [Porphyrobacter sp.]
MNKELRDRFAELHKPGDPLLLYNIWDVGSARAVAAAGAPALATGSHALAGCNGFADGEQVPFNLFLDCIRRIAEGVEVPVTADFEGGFAADPARLADHAQYLAETGVVGCNFEDQEIGGHGLHPIEHQAARVAAVVTSGLWVNARTDVFLQRYVAGEDANDRSLLGEAMERAAAYAEAGARSLFVPGPTEPELIAEICQRSPLPVNILMLKGAPDWRVLAEAGVARVSWGGGPWRKAMQTLTDEAKALYAG